MSSRTKFRTGDLGLIFQVAVFIALPAINSAKAQDTSEALRLWKFTYHMEAAAYGIQYMSQDLLTKAGKQLDAAAGQTMVTSTPMRVCIDAAEHLSDYFELAAKGKGQIGSSDQRKRTRQRYEMARAGCIRLLGSDPTEYPLGWPE